MKRISKLIALSIILFSLTFSYNRVSAQDDADKSIRIALLLDTSNSMDGLIDQAKSQLWELVNGLSEAKCDGKVPDLKIALYEYGNSGLSLREGYIRQVSSLTSDLDKISEDLFSLTTNGGSEYCGWVINTTLMEQEWSANKKDLQIIFIAGNEPFNQGRVDYKAACLDAKERNVIVNTIFCGDFDEGISSFWKRGAELTNGEYMCIEQDRKTVFIPSPYDDRITELNKELNKTYLGYGRLGRRKKVVQLDQDSNAAKYDKANMVKRAVSKSSHFYKNSTWDVVDAYKDNSKFLEEQEEKDLPKELQGLSLNEKQEYVEELAQKRIQINKQIKEFNQKRKIHIENLNQSEDNNMLDKAMISAIVKQAKEKGFTF